MKYIELFRIRKEVVLHSIQPLMSKSEFLEISNEVNIFINLLNEETLNYFYYDKVFEKVNINILKTIVNIFQRIFKPRYNDISIKNYIYIMDSILTLYIYFFNLIRYEIKKICNSVIFLNKSHENYIDLLPIYTVPLFSLQ